MGKVVRTVIGAALVVAGVVTGNFALVGAGAQLLSSTLLGPRAPRRAAAAATLQIGEQPRQGVFGRAATAGSLVDAFNFGGKYGTDWEVLVISLADHRCDALEGFFVDDRYVAFAADGNVTGFNNQLQVFWRSGTWDQTVPTILTTNGPGWTANDRGRGVAYVVVAYKSDASDAKNPVWPSGRPRFRWVVRGLRCYQARLDSTVGGSGAHRWNNPATWQWTENPIDIAHNWRRGIYAGDLIDQPGMLLIGRGLSEIEAPPQNVFARANLCDELVNGVARYRIGGVAASTEAFIDVESDFAAACAGVISQPEGAVEVDPGEARAPVAHFTDADLIVGSKVRWNEGILGQQDASWLNTVIARYVEPAQRWRQHSAPVLRHLPDIVADGAPREQQLALDFITNGAQAQRVGEVFRRLGRLWGRGTVTLPPRFAYIEEGDWVTWQSARRFAGATLTFRVEAWGSDRAWHHTLNLRQISASVYSDTAPLDDGSIAADQAPPPVVAAPEVGVWAVAGVQLDGGGVRAPALRITGASDDPAAQFVVFEYVQQADAPDAATVWTFAASSRPDVTRFDIPVAIGGTFWAAVSYVVDGIAGDRRVIGPITAAAFEVDADGPGLVGTFPWDRTDGPGRPESFTFGARGVSAVPPSDYADGLFDEGGNSLGGLIRSYRVFHRVIGSATWVTQGFDVFGTAGDNAAMAAHLNAIPDGALVVVLGFDEPRNNRLGGGLPQAMYRCGASRSVFGRNNWMFRPAYALIGRAGIGEGMGTELYQDGGADSSPDSWISGTFSVVNGLPVLGLRRIRGAEDIAYPDGVRLDEVQPSETGADVTATAQRSIVPQFPVIEIRQGEAGHTGNRMVLHSAQRGTANLLGGTWSVPAQNLGAGSATISSSTGTVTLSAIVQSGSYTVRYTHTDGIATDLKVNVTFIAGEQIGTASDGPVGLINIAGTSFVMVSTRELEITLPGGVTEATLTAQNVSLQVEPASPTGASVIELRWDRETSPGTWAAVGADASSSPSPTVVNEGEGLLSASPGAITCNRTASGLSAGSTQKFRLMGRISSGNTRTIFVSGTSAAAS